jgi:hypothetical protein
MRPSQNFFCGQFSKKSPQPALKYSPSPGCATESHAAFRASPSVRAALVPANAATTSAATTTFRMGPLLAAAF